MKPWWTSLLECGRAMSKTARYAASPTSLRSPGTCQPGSTPFAPNWNERCSGCPWREVLPWIQQRVQTSQQPLRHYCVEAEVKLKIGYLQHLPPPCGVHEGFALDIKGSEFYFSVVDAVFVDRGTILRWDSQQVGR